MDTLTIWAAAAIPVQQAEQKQHPLLVIGLYRTAGPAGEQRKTADGWRKPIERVIRRHYRDCAAGATDVAMLAIMAATYQELYGQHEKTELWFP